MLRYPLVELGHNKIINQSLPLSAPSPSLQVTFKLCVMGYPTRSNELGYPITMYSQVIILHVFGALADRKLFPGKFVFS